MGDPKRNKKKYKTPSHPWQKERLDHESLLRKKYGTKNKKEIWKTNSEFKKLLARAKQTVSAGSVQAEIEKGHLLQRVHRLGLLSENATVDDILNLTVDDFFKRRLQTILVDRKMAHSVKQARQFIVHGHILVGDMKITSPSYMVPIAVEDSICFSSGSPLVSAEHPELVKLQEKQSARERAEKVEAEVKKKDEAAAAEKAASQKPKEKSQKSKISDDARDKVPTEQEQKQITPDKAAQETPAPKSK